MADQSMYQPVNLDFEEDVDGVRFNWNKWPMSNLELTLGCLYTPLKEPSTYTDYYCELLHDPLVCSRPTCRAVLNPYCYPDLQSKIWTCNFCNNRNPFPQQYHQARSREEIPELVRTTIDYTLTNQFVPNPPVFLFVVDTSIDEEEFASLRQSLLTSLSLLPKNACVGFITFNRTVYLWELSNSKHLKSFIFCGQKSYQAKQLQEWLGVGNAQNVTHSNAIAGAPNMPPLGVPNNIRPGQPPITNGHHSSGLSQQSYLPQNAGMRYAQPLPNQIRPQVPPGVQTAYGAPMLGARLPNVTNANSTTFKNNVQKFIKPASQIIPVFEEITDQVGKNTWPVVDGRRRLRAVGAAMSVALNLLETTYPQSGARIMLFLGGPCTVGPGMVIDDDLKNTIRTHNDIEKDNAKYMKKAAEFYKSLAVTASKNGHTIDIFSGCLDQTGLHEMKYCTNMTSGLMVMCDSFDSNLFKTSFQRLFAKDKKQNLQMAFNAVLDVKTSRGLKVSGAIGSCISLDKRTQYVSDRKDGLGGTSEWKFCSLTPSTTTALYFIVQAAPTPPQSIPIGYVQFITQYQGSDGYKHTRSTTVRRYFGTDDFEFDQESAAVLIARMACFRSDNTDSNGPEVLRWLDKNLIKICQKFGEFQKDSPESFRLKERFAMFPQFIFNLRRSQFIQVFNNSPDETSFYRHTLMREDCSNSLLMVQPALFAYELYQETRPVSLDTSSIQPDRILVMDTFFQIVIFHGEKVAAWKKQGYQNQEGYEAFKQFLEAPINDASDLMLCRFPLPRYVVCDQGSSQARFLLSRVNPSITHNTNTGYYTGKDSEVLTDDVAYGVFEEHLKKLAVSSAS